MFLHCIIVTTAVFSASVALAEETTPEFADGHNEYLASCAACHGEAADGNGEIAAMFTEPVPDLTEIALRNDGSFPLLKVIQTIDGRAVIRGHGVPMPVFGSRYRAEANGGNAMFGAEAIARVKVLELALFLQSLQKK